MIAVSNRLPAAAVELLREAGEVRIDERETAIPRQDLLELVAGADAVLTLLGDRVDDELLEAAGPKLRCVANVAVGYDNVDLEAAERRGVIVTNTPGVLDDATADLTLALILATTRRIVEGDRLVRSGRDWNWGMGFMLGSALQGQLLGIVGLGGIGKWVAQRARAFGMKIAYHQRNPAPAEVEKALDAERMPLERLLAEADVLSLHCPLTPETHHLIGAAELAAMKPSAVLINAARGPIVDRAALEEALQSGRLGGVGLDVFWEEPWDPRDPLFAREDVIALPHIGGTTEEAFGRVADVCAENVRRLGAGEPLLHRIA